MSAEIPVLTIDGPSGSGKGATASSIAKKLHWHLLDSGSIYRAMAWLLDEQKECQQYLQDETALSNFVASHCDDFTFQDARVFYQQREITSFIRTDKLSLLTSDIAKIKGIRQAVLSLQRSFVQPPGLVADGRDMGSVVFPDAPFKVFLTANVQTRAKRRYLQLSAGHNDVDYDNILSALKQRDEQDQNRTLAPLKIPQNAVIIDNSELSLEQVVEQILQLINSN